VPGFYFIIRRIWIIFFSTVSCKFFFSLQDCLEIQKDACSTGQKVIIVDDLIATGGNFIDIVFVQTINNLAVYY